MKDDIRGNYPKNENAVNPEQITANSLDNLTITSQQSDSITTKPKPTKSRKLKYPSKIETCLGFFIKLGVVGMNTQDANELYGDTTIRSVVSDLHNEYHIPIQRKPDPQLNRVGSYSQFVRYWIDSADMDKAKRLHNLLRSKRGQAPMYDISPGVRS